MKNLSTAAFHALHAYHDECSICAGRTPPSPLLTDKERARYERLPLKPRWGYDALVADAMLTVKKTVGIIPHDCEGGAGCAFPDLEHLKP